VAGALSSTEASAPAITVSAPAPAEPAPAPEIGGGGGGGGGMYRAGSSTRLMARERAARIAQQNRLLTMAAAQIAAGEFECRR
jgi:hypothetical protein